MRISGLGYLLKEGIKSIWSNRLMSIASIGVLLSCMLLTGAAELIVLNISGQIERTGGKNVTRVFLEQEVTDLEAVYIKDEIGKHSNISKTELADMLFSFDAISENSSSISKTCLSIPNHLS